MARVGWLETFGLRPLGPALRQSWQAVVGDGYAPPGRWGLSSLRIFKVRVSFPLWLGRRAGRRVGIYLLPNRDPADPDAGYSVRVTHARDFRGRQLSYDGHVGTDFATPVGTPITTVAPGVVRQVRNDMQRGGLKVVVDHGGGLITTYNHLARATVGVGERLRRGEALGLSGMSSVDGLLFAPFLAPHLHLNVLLGGEPVDPFAAPGETSLWRSGAPVPHRGEPVEALPPTRWRHDAVDATIASCRDPELRASLEAEGDRDARSVATVVARFFMRHRFTTFVPLCEAEPRRPVLDLPFSADDYDGAYFVDEPVSASC